METWTKTCSPGGFIFDPSPFKRFPAVVGKFVWGSVHFGRGLEQTKCFATIGCEFCSGCFLNFLVLKCLEVAKFNNFAAGLPSKTLFRV